jgi:hypothetical protein
VREFTLIVKNGKNGDNRVSAALIWVNEKQVMRVEEFNQQVDELRRTRLLEKENELMVEPRSKPGAFITLNIMGEGRNTPPVANAGPDQEKQGCRPFSQNLDTSRLCKKRKLGSD